jgi:hypothetical protein
MMIESNISPFSVPSSMTTFAQMSNLNQTGSSSDEGLKFAYTKLGVLGGIYQLISYDSKADVLTIRNTSPAIPTQSNTQSNSQSASTGDFDLSDNDFSQSGGAFNQEINTQSNTQSNSQSMQLSGQSNTQSNIQSNVQLSESEENNLKQLINNNGFFQANSIYPPLGTKGALSYTLLYILSITTDNNRSHTVLWTDTSNNVPSSLLSIVQAIERFRDNDNQSNNQQNMNGGDND